MNQEIIRAKAIIAELRLNNEKSHQLIHTQKNLLTVQLLILEQIHGTLRHTRQPQASIPRLTTARITKELSNLTIEVEKHEERKGAMNGWHTDQDVKAIREIADIDPVIHL